MDITFLPNDVTSKQVMNDEISSLGWGHPRYIAHSDLGYNAAKKCQYLKDNCLYFRIGADAKTSSKPWLI